MNTEVELTHNPLLTIHDRSDEFDEIYNGNCEGPGFAPSQDDGYMQASLGSDIDYQQHFERVKAHLYGKTLSAEKISFLPIFFYILVNRLIFFRVTILYIDPETNKIYKVYSKLKTTKRSAEQLKEEILENLKYRNANHQIFYNLIRNRRIKSKIQEFMRTFSPDISFEERRKLNKKYKCIIKAVSFQPSTSKSSAYVITVMKGVSKFHTFMRIYDEGCGKYFTLAPFPREDRAFLNSVEKQATYSNAFQHGFGKEVYPLSDLWAPDFLTDCVKFQDITKAALMQSYPPTFNHGDIVLIERSLFHFEPFVVLFRENGTLRFVKFVKGPEKQVLTTYVDDWNELIGDKDNISYILRMFSIIPYDTPQNITTRAQNPQFFSKKVNWFCRLFHQTPAEFVVFGEEIKMPSPRKPLLVNRILKTIAEKLFIDKIDDEQGKNEIIILFIF